MLLHWFWHSCFAKRYSNSVDTAMSQDIAAFKQLKDNNYADIEKRTHRVTSEFFTENVFSLTSVNTKIFVLLLAMAKPKSFLSNASVDLDKVLTSCNRTEFHHIFPKNYLVQTENVVERSQQFMLANFAFLSQTDNRTIQDKAPSEYVKCISQDKLGEIMNSAMIPAGGLGMSYSDFVAARAKMLAAAANNLLG